MHTLSWLPLGRKDGGQNGIVSCIGMHPERTGMYALGTYSGTGERMHVLRLAHGGPLVGHPEPLT